MYVAGKFVRKSDSSILSKSGIYMANVEVTVWRSVRKEEFPNGTVIDGSPADAVLHPSFVKTLITGGKRKGQWRDPDVYTFKSNDVLYAQTGGGTSMFDKPGVFGTAYWHLFEIPKGTPIPDSLKFEGPDYNPVYDANHYQIESRAKTMRVDAMKGALDNLARNAIVRKIELAGSK